MQKIITIALLSLTLNVAAQKADTAKWVEYVPDYNELDIWASELTGNIIAYRPHYKAQIRIYGAWDTNNTPWVPSEGGIDFHTNAGIKSPLWITLKKDTAYLSIDTMLMELLNKAKVIIAGDRVFKIKPPEIGPNEKYIKKIIKNK